MVKEIVYDDPELNEKAAPAKIKKRSRFVVLAIFLVIISLVVGMIGGIGGIVVLIVKIHRAFGRAAVTEHPDLIIGVAEAVL